MHVAEMIRAVAAASNVATSLAAVAVDALLQARESKVEAVLQQAREARVAGGNRDHANKAGLPASRVATVNSARPASKPARASRVKIGVVTAVAVVATGTRATALPAIVRQVVGTATSKTAATGVATAAAANNARPNRPRKTNNDTVYNSLITPVLPAERGLFILQF